MMTDNEIALRTQEAWQLGRESGYQKALIDAITFFKDHIISDKGMAENIPWVIKELERMRDE